MKARAIAYSSSILLTIFACSSSDPIAVPNADGGDPETSDAPLGSDTKSADAKDGAPDKAANCASTFGSSLTDAFGRLDGTIVAVVPPAHPTCPMPNGDHIVLQIAMNGAVYRAVINVLSTKGAPDSSDSQVRYGELDHALPAPAFAEGWHAGLSFDYVTDLTIHSTGGTFAPKTMSDLTARVIDRLEVGAKVSVYSTSSGGASSHLVHRNLTNKDGAIVIDPESVTPKFLVFSFAEQTF